MIFINCGLILIQAFYPIQLRLYNKMGNIRFDQNEMRELNYE